LPNIPKGPKYAKTALRRLLELNQTASEDDIRAALSRLEADCAKSAAIEVGRLRTLAAGLLEECRTGKKLPPEGQALVRQVSENHNGARFLGARVLDDIRKRT